MHNEDKIIIILLIIISFGLRDRSDLTIILQTKF